MNMQIDMYVQLYVQLYVHMCLGMHVHMYVHMYGDMYYLRPKTEFAGGLQMSPRSQIFRKIDKAMWNRFL